MQMVAPVGPMYQAGTLSGNPLAMAAGMATLETLGLEGHWARLHEYGRKLDEGLLAAAQQFELPVVINRVGTMSGMYFLKDRPQDWQQVSQANSAQFKIFFHAMLEHGVFLAPSPFEAAFISTAHDEEALAITLQAAHAAFQAVAEKSPAAS